MVNFLLSRPFSARIFNPYRPELHYMRGPGPACRAKQLGVDGIPTSAHDSSVSVEAGFCDHTARCHQGR